MSARAGKARRLAVVVAALIPWSSAGADEVPTLNYEPQPFVYSPGHEVRYIDHRDGDDANDGRRPERAWRHHPWDAAARGRAASARGVDTYVFRRGVTYRARSAPR